MVSTCKALNHEVRRTSSQPSEPKANVSTSSTSAANQLTKSEGQVNQLTQRINFFNYKSQTSRNKSKYNPLHKPKTKSSLLRPKDQRLQASSPFRTRTSTPLPSNFSTPRGQTAEQTPQPTQEARTIFWPFWA